MLRLEQVVKLYATGDLALRGIVGVEDDVARERTAQSRRPDGDVGGGFVSIDCDDIARHDFCFLAQESCRDCCNSSELRIVNEYNMSRIAAFP